MFFIKRYEDCRQAVSIVEALQIVYTFVPKELLIILLGGLIGICVLNVNDRRKSSGNRNQKSENS